MSGIDSASYKVSINGNSGSDDSQATSNKYLQNVRNSSSSNYSNGGI